MMDDVLLCKCGARTYEEHVAMAGSTSTGHVYSGPVRMAADDPWYGGTKERHGEAQAS